MADPDPLDLIARKRDGGELDEEDIVELVDAYTAGAVPDYQMSAFLMAVMLRGMNETESFALAHAMLYSGTVLDLSDIPGKKVDKHSTGGVGDKISLVLAPLVAAAGVPVPMISGGGLGHTGGTLDKLSSIPGLQVSLSLDQYRKQLREIGVVMIGQTDEIAPADKKLYALRDVTGTVEFIPFIAASIMSKKLAEGIDALVLDVKVGRGAFMPDMDAGRRLARTLEGIGAAFDRPTVSLLTLMDDPLGLEVGNWNEVVEAVRCMRGEPVEDVRELTVALAVEMLILGGAAETARAASKMAERILDSGAAFEKFMQMVAAQGGDTRVVEDASRREGTHVTVEVQAGPQQEGYISSIDARVIGSTAMRLGAGRRAVNDEIDPMAGITICRRKGEPVQPGDCLARLHTRDADTAAPFMEAVRRAFAASRRRPDNQPIVVDRLSDGKWSSGAA